MIPPLVLFVRIIPGKQWSIVINRKIILPILLTHSCIRSIIWHRKTFQVMHYVKW